MPDRNSSSHYPALIPAIGTIPMKRQAGKDNKSAGGNVKGSVYDRFRCRLETLIRLDFGARLRYTCRDSTESLSQ